MKKWVIAFCSILFVGVLGIVYLLYNDGYFDGEQEELSRYMPLTYEVCDDNSCVYLLGSFHMGDIRLTRFDEKLLDYFNKSDYLAVEIDINKMNMFELANQFIQDEDKSIDIILGEDLKERLISFLDEKNSMVSYEQLSLFKMGYISNYLSTLVTSDLKFNSLGVDAYFLNIAQNSNKDVIELETLEEQINLLIGYSDEFYKKQIEDTIENYDDSIKSLKEIYEAYLKADESNLRKLLSEDQEVNDNATEEEKEYLKAMYYDRNVKMAENVQKFLNEDKEAFVVVGALHVIGEDGIIELLQDKNYKINVLK